MSEFGAHEPQPNECNGDANNHTSETAEQVAGPCHAGAHAHLHRAPRQTWPSGRSKETTCTAPCDLQLPPRPLPELQAPIGSLPCAGTAHPLLAPQETIPATSPDYPLRQAIPPRSRRRMTVRASARSSFSALPSPSTPPSLRT